MSLNCNKMESREIYSLFYCSLWKNRKRMFRL
nr:MAG TPA: hypothetical protein [Caudoviricetes sp.]